MTAIKVNLRGFEEGVAMFHHAVVHFRDVVGQELKIWGDENVEWLKTKVTHDELGLEPKKRNDGKPPLVDTTNYIMSYGAFLSEWDTLGIVSVGMNTFMSNQDLAELLEYGWNHSPPRPHLRPLGVHMQHEAGVLGSRITKSLFRV